MTVSGVDGRRSTGSWLRTSQCGAGRTIYSSTPTRPRRWRWTSNGTNHAYNLKSIEGVDVELVQTYTYLGLQLDDRLGWSANIDILHRKGHLYFLRRPGSVNIRKKLIQMFYQSAVALVPFHTVVGWAGSSKKEDTARLGKAGEKGWLCGGPWTNYNTHHPLHSTFTRQKSMFSTRLLSQSCSTDRLRNSLVPPGH